jgi:hypothetical protein
MLDRFSAYRRQTVRRATSVSINRLLKHWHQTDRDRARRGFVVSYVDDFVIVSCDRAASGTGVRKF